MLTARVLQGVATAMTMPSAMTLLTTTFQEGATRDRVLGLNGAMLSGGFTVGALVGGTLVGLLSWRAAFFINIPVALASTGYWVTLAMIWSAAILAILAPLAVWLYRRSD